MQKKTIKKHNQQDTGWTITLFRLCWDLKSLREMKT